MKKSNKKAISVIPTNINPRQIVLLCLGFAEEQRKIIQDQKQIIAELNTKQKSFETLVLARLAKLESNIPTNNK